MADTKVEVRAYADTDGDTVREVLLDAYSEYADSLSQERWELYKNSILASVSEAETSARLVAAIDGKIVGSVFLFDSSESAYGNPELDIRNPIIRLLAVSKQARGKGVATELILASARLLLERGEDTLHLHTSDLMASAVRLYERLGFERAYDKEFLNGDILVKSYKLHLAKTPLLHGIKEETNHVQAQTN